jgi:hypothetical protein
MSTYIDGPFSKNGGAAQCWRTHTWWNLEWQYGSERAERIMAGRDPKTQADRARWNALGRRSAA